MYSIIYRIQNLCLNIWDWCETKQRWRTCPRTPPWAHNGTYMHNMLFPARQRSSILLWNLDAGLCKKVVGCHQGVCQTWLWSVEYHSNTGSLCLLAWGHSSHTRTLTLERIIWINLCCMIIFCCLNKMYIYNHLSVFIFSIMYRLWDWLLSISLFIGAVFTWGGRGWKPSPSYVNHASINKSKIIWAFLILK